MRGTCHKSIQVYADLPGRYFMMNRVQVIGSAFKRLNPQPFIYQGPQQA
jgi:hypothetical protein